VHHIVEWATSRNNQEENLAVLCLDDHDKAHKTGGHTQNLTARLIRKAKADWEVKVRQLDTRAILEASAEDADSWWLFNHVRLFELAEHFNLRLDDIERFRWLKAARLLGSDGRPTCRNARTSSWMYDGEYGMSLYAYMRGVLNAVLQRLTALNISDDLDRGFLGTILNVGDFIIAQGAYVFRRESDVTRGPGQTVLGIRRANKVEIYFRADRWEATASSAHSGWLSGRHEAICLLRVMSIEEEGKTLRIGTTALAIGAPLAGIKSRDYANAPYRTGYYRWDSEDEEEMEDF
jgi:hypothetical protein